ncbi:MAG: helix-turn-helix domain-containing protein [Firmicutes bacterium]|nr:helix-turn-helix domain-containing protein [Bacillota bacterium]
MKSLFDEKIKEFRDYKNLSQGDLANIFNVTRQTVSAWENGIQETDFSTLINLAKFFDVTVGQLLGVEEI